MKLLRCTLCGKPLRREGGSCRCPAGHCFDLAKEGYVNLLPVQEKNSKDPGDDKAMAAARRAFLEAGHYAPLRDALCAIALEGTGNRLAALDAGCGEGYYTAGLYAALTAAGKAVTMAGTDISKHILRCAPRRAPAVEFAVASSFHLPLEAESVDLLLNCFSPLALEEFTRILRPGGRFLYVVPGAAHLWELKQLLYEAPYQNEEKLTPYPGFSYERVVPVETTLHLRSAQEIQNLFAMTPYVWKTPRAGRERLAALEALSVRASFRIHVFSKEHRKEA